LKSDAAKISRGGRSGARYGGLLRHNHTAWLIELETTSVVKEKHIFSLSFRETDSFHHNFLQLTTCSMIDLPHP
jgi:hypothetical protein